MQVISNLHRELFLAKVKTLANNFHFYHVVLTLNLSQCYFMLINIRLGIFIAVLDYFKQSGACY